MAEETWVRFPLGARTVLKLRAPGCVCVVQMPYADAAVAIATRPLVTTTPVAGGTGHGNAFARGADTQLTTTCRELRGVECGVSHVDIAEWLLPSGVWSVE